MVRVRVRVQVQALVLVLVPGRKSAVGRTHDSILHKPSLRRTEQADCLLRCRPELLRCPVSGQVAGRRSLGDILFPSEKEVFPATDDVLGEIDDEALGSHRSILAQVVEAAADRSVQTYCCFTVDLCHGKTETVGLRNTTLRKQDVM